MTDQEWKEIESYADGFTTGFKAGELKCAAFMEANEQLVEENKRLRNALQLLDDSIEFVETEHGANYVITTDDKKIIKEALNPKNNGDQN